MKTFIKFNDDLIDIDTEKFNYVKDNANYYKNTFQHGGISMEEIMIPLITLSNS